jgi:hypothetical protein
MMNWSKQHVARYDIAAQGAALLRTPDPHPLLQPALSIDEAGAALHEARAGAS